MHACEIEETPETATGAPVILLVRLYSPEEVTAWQAVMFYGKRCRY